MKRHQEDPGGRRPASLPAARRAVRTANAALARLGVRITARDALAFRLQSALLNKPVRLRAEPLTDGVVVLRRLRPSDARVLHEFSHEDPRAWLAEHDTLYEAGQAVDLGVAEPGRDDLRGLVQLQRFDWPNRRASVGLWLTPDARGQGIMTRSLRLLVSWVFEDRVLDRIEYLARADNDRSLQLAQRCGFREEGRLRACLVEERHRHDAVLLAAVAGDWHDPGGAARVAPAREEGDKGE